MPETLTELAVTLDSIPPPTRQQREDQARRDQETQDRIDAWHANRRLHCPEEYDGNGNHLPFGSFC